LTFIVIYGKLCGPSTIWLAKFFKISSFVFSRRKKFIQIWNNLRVSDDRMKKTYPFKFKEENKKITRVAE